MLAGEVVRLKDILGDQVEALSSWTYSDIAWREEVKAVLLAYERALDRCHKVLVDIARLDLDARMVRISEIQAAAIGRVIKPTLTRLDLPADVLTQANEIVANELEREADGA